MDFVKSKYLSVIMVAASLMFVFAIQQVFAQSKSDQILDIINTATGLSDNVKTEASSSSWSGSIMYSSDELKLIQQAIKSYETNIPLEILLPNLFPKSGVVEVERNDKSVETRVEDRGNETFVAGSGLITDSPVFYLNSILYFSPENWTIWINNQKIKYGDTNVRVSYGGADQDSNADKTLSSLESLVSNVQYMDIDIVDINGEEVSVIWKNSQLDKIFPEWRDQLKPVDGNSQQFLSNYRNIVVDKNSGNISFVLRNNQSMVSRVMKIVEGKIAQDTQNNLSQEKVDTADNILYKDSQPLYRKSLSGYNIAEDSADVTKQLDRLRDNLRK